MSVEAFTPVIDPATNLQTCVQATTGGTSARVKLAGQQVLVKALTNTAYIKLGGGSVTVSATDGYYMAVGDEVRWQVQKGATHLAHIQGAGAGALSIAYGVGD